MAAMILFGSLVQVNGFGFGRIVTASCDNTARIWDTKIESMSELTGLF
jgi:hypothetical protein